MSTAPISNISQLYKSFSRHATDRRTNLLKGAGWAAAGGAMAVGGVAYNRSQGHQTVGGDLGVGIGLAGGAFMGGRSAGLGRLMTAGGLQRMGQRFSMRSEGMQEGAIKSMFRSTGGGLNNAAKWTQAGLDESFENVMNSPGLSAAHRKSAQGRYDSLSNGFFEEGYSRSI